MLIGNIIPHSGFPLSMVLFTVTIILGLCFFRYIFSNTQACGSLLTIGNSPLP
jgi:hypothetical protein